MQKSALVAHAKFSLSPNGLRNSLRESASQNKCIASYTTDKLPATLKPRKFLLHCTVKHRTVGQTPNNEKENCRLEIQLESNTANPSQVESIR